MNSLIRTSWHSSPECRSGIWAWEETEEDMERAENGCISLQLRHPEIDNTHLNDAGYRALARGIYEKGIELGYW